MTTHADRKAQGELERLRGETELLGNRLNEIEKVLSAMRQVPDIDRIMKEAVDKY